MWILSHIDILGNKETERMAYVATTSSTSIPINKMPSIDVKYKAQKRILKL